MVGANGSGKTTLAKLLAGLYLPDDGQVSWDGADTREFDGRELLARTAIVFQDFIRYALSAGDDIALGRHERAADTAAIIGDLFADRSVLLISHRFSTVRSASRIYVLDHGAVVEHGTHDELLAAGSTYAGLFTLQASPYQR